MQGPYLVRTVSLQGDTVSITGDWSNTTTLEVFAPSCVSRVNFNGANLHVKETSYGSLVGTLVGAADGGVAAVINTLPSLATWKVTDGLPERLSSYDDSKWIGKLMSIKKQACSRNTDGVGSGESHHHAKSKQAGNASSSLCR